MAVYFHGNFGLNRERMAGLLKFALENAELKDKELAESFGYGAPYAQRYRQWLYRAGITTLRLPLILTPRGTVVYENDPALETLETQWFMHWELVTDPIRAETWHFFYNKFLPTNEHFSKDGLQMALMEELRHHSEEHFGPESTMLPGITRKILECYIKEYALGNLCLIKLQTDGTYLWTASNIRNP